MSMSPNESIRATTTATAPIQPSMPKSEHSPGLLSSIALRELELAYKAADELISNQFKTSDTRRSPAHLESAFFSPTAGNFKQSLDVLKSFQDRTESALAFSKRVTNSLLSSANSVPPLPNAAKPPSTHAPFMEAPQQKPLVETEAQLLEKELQWKLMSDEQVLRNFDMFVALPEVKRASSIFYGAPTLVTSADATHNYASALPLSLLPLLAEHCGVPIEDPAETDAGELFSLGLAHIRKLMLPTSENAEPNKSYESVGTEHAFLSRNEFFHWWKRHTLRSLRSQLTAKITSSSIATDAADVSKAIVPVDDAQLDIPPPPPPLPNELGSALVKLATSSDEEEEQVIVTSEEEADEEEDELHKLPTSLLPADKVQEYIELLQFTESDEWAQLTSREKRNFVRKMKALEEEGITIEAMNAQMEYLKELEARKLERQMLKQARLEERKNRAQKRREALAERRRQKEEAKLAQTATAATAGGSINTYLAPIGVAKPSKAEPKSSLLAETIRSKLSTKSLLASSTIEPQKGEAAWINKYKQVPTSAFSASGSVDDLKTKANGSSDPLLGISRAIGGEPDKPVTLETNLHKTLLSESQTNPAEGLKQKIKPSLLSNEWRQMFSSTQSPLTLAITEVALETILAALGGGKPDSANAPTADAATPQISSVHNWDGNKFVSSFPAITSPAQIHNLWEFIDRKNKEMKNLRLMPLPSLLPLEFSLANDTNVNEKELDELLLEDDTKSVESESIGAETIRSDISMDAGGKKFLFGYDRLFCLMSLTREMASIPGMTHFLQEYDAMIAGVLAQPYFLLNPAASLKPAVPTAEDLAQLRQEKPYIEGEAYDSNPIDLHEVQRSIRSLHNAPKDRIGSPQHQLSQRLSFLLRLRDQSSRSLQEESTEIRDIDQEERREIDWNGIYQSLYQQRSERVANAASKAVAMTAFHALFQNTVARAVRTIINEISLRNRDKTIKIINIPNIDELEEAEEQQKIAYEEYIYKIRLSAADPYLADYSHIQPVPCPLPFLSTMDAVFEYAGIYIQISSGQWDIVHTMFNNAQDELLRFVHQKSNPSYSSGYVVPSPLAPLDSNSTSEHERNFHRNYLQGNCMLYYANATIQREWVALHGPPSKRIENNALPIPSVHPVLTTVMQYAGFHFLASVPPPIQDEQSLIFGSICPALPTYSNENEEFIAETSPYSMLQALISKENTPFKSDSLLINEIASTIGQKLNLKEEDVLVYSEVKLPLAQKKTSNTLIFDEDDLTSSSETDTDTSDDDTSDSDSDDDTTAIDGELTAYQTQNILTQQKQALPLHLQIHVGTDNRFYMLNTHFLPVYFPEDHQSFFNDSIPGKQGRAYYDLAKELLTSPKGQFRPEFLRYYPHPLSAHFGRYATLDSATAVQSPAERALYGNGAQPAPPNMQGIHDALQYIKNVCIPHFVRYLSGNEKSPSPHVTDKLSLSDLSLVPGVTASTAYLSSDMLTKQLHAAGINVRFLGEVARQCTNDITRELIEVEMVARAVKRLLQMAWREETSRRVMDRLYHKDVPFERTMSEIAVQIFNAVLGQSNMGFLFWNYFIRPTVEKKFKYTLKALRLNEATPQDLQGFIYPNSLLEFFEKYRDSVQHRSFLPLYSSQQLFHVLQHHTSVMFNPDNPLAPSGYVPTLTFSSNSHASATLSTFFAKTQTEHVQKPASQGPFGRPDAATTTSAHANNPFARSSTPSPAYGGSLLFLPTYLSSVSQESICSDFISTITRDAEAAATGIRTSQNKSTLATLRGKPVSVVTSTGTVVTVPGAAAQPRIGQGQQRLDVISTIDMYKELTPKSIPALCEALDSMEPQLTFLVPSTTHLTLDELEQESIERRNQYKNSLRKALSFSALDYKGMENTASMTKNDISSSEVVINGTTCSVGSMYDFSTPMPFEETDITLSKSLGQLISPVYAFSFLPSLSDTVLAPELAEFSTSAESFLAKKDLTSAMEMYNLRFCMLLAMHDSSHSYSERLAQTLAEVADPGRVKELGFTAMYNSIVTAADADTGVAQGLQRTLQSMSQEALDTASTFNPLLPHRRTTYGNTLPGTSDDTSRKNQYDTMYSGGMSQLVKEKIESMVKNEWNKDSNSMASQDRTSRKDELAMVPVHNGTASFYHKLQSYNMLHVSQASDSELDAMLMSILQCHPTARPHLALILLQVARICLIQEKYTQAESLAKLVLRFISGTHVLAGYSLLLQAQVQILKGEVSPNEFMNTFAQALTALRLWNRTRSPIAVYLYSTLGETLIRKQRFAVASSMYQLAQSEAEYCYPKHHPLLSVLAYRTSCIAMHCFNRAMHLMLQCTQLFENSHPLSIFASSIAKYHLLAALKYSTSTNSNVTALLLKNSAIGPKTALSAVPSPPGQGTGTNNALALVPMQEIPPNHPTEQVFLPYSSLQSNTHVPYISLSERANPNFSMYTAFDLENAYGEVPSSPFGALSNSDLVYTPRGMQCRAILLQSTGLFLAGLHLEAIQVALEALKITEDWKRRRDQWNLVSLASLPNLNSNGEASAPIASLLSPVPSVNGFTANATVASSPDELKKLPAIGNVFEERTLYMQTLQHLCGISERVNTSIDTESKNAILRLRIYCLEMLIEEVLWDGIVTTSTHYENAESSKNAHGEAANGTATSVAKDSSATDTLVINETPRIAGDALSEDAMSQNPIVHSMIRILTTKPLPSLAIGNIATQPNAPAPETPAELMEKLAPFGDSLILLVPHLIHFAVQSISQHQRVVLQSALSEVFLHYLKEYQPLVAKENSAVSSTDPSVPFHRTIESLSVTAQGAARTIYQSAADSARLFTVDRHTRRREANPSTRTFVSPYPSPFDALSLEEINRQKKAYAYKQWTFPSAIEYVLRVLLQYTSRSLFSDFGKDKDLANHRLDEDLGNLDSASVSPFVYISKVLSRVYSVVTDNQFHLLYEPPSPPIFRSMALNAQAKSVQVSSMPTLQKALAPHEDVDARAAPPLGLQFAALMLLLADDTTRYGVDLTTPTSRSVSSTISLTQLWEMDEPLASIIAGLKSGAQGPVYQAVTHRYRVFPAISRKDAIPHNFLFSLVQPPAKVDPEANEKPDVSDGQSQDGDNTSAILYSSWMDVQAITSGYNWVDINAIRNMKRYSKFKTVGIL